MDPYLSSKVKEAAEAIKTGDKDKANDILDTCLEQLSVAEFTREVLGNKYLTMSQLREFFGLNS